MADNVAITPGSGATVRTVDNGSGFQKQVMMIDVGGESAESLAIGLVPVGGKTVSVNVALTRAANTTAYTAGFAITNGSNTYLTFANAARVSGGSGVVIGVTLVDQNNAATPLQPVLYLFNTTPATTLTDGAALALSAADALLLIGVVPLVTSYLANAGAGSAGVRVYTAQGLNIGFKAVGTGLYGVLQAGVAYTPLSAEVLTTQIQVLQD